MLQKSSGTKYRPIPKKYPSFITRFGSIIRFEPFCKSHISVSTDLNFPLKNLFDVCLYLIRSIHDLRLASCFTTNYHHLITLHYCSMSKSLFLKIPIQRPLVILELSDDTFWRWTSSKQKCWLGSWCNRIIVYLAIKSVNSIITWVEISFSTV